MVILYVECVPIISNQPIWWNFEYFQGFGYDSFGNKFVLPAKISNLHFPLSRTKHPLLLETRNASCNDQPRRGVVRCLVQLTGSNHRLAEVVEPHFRLPMSMLSMLGFATLRLALGDSVQASVLTSRNACIHVYILDNTSPTNSYVARSGSPENPTSSGYNAAISACGALETTWCWWVIRWHPMKWCQPNG